MATPTPVDQDAVNPNFLNMLASLQARVEDLERQAASGLFDGDTMRPPAHVTIDNGNLEIVGNRGIFNSRLNLGSEVALTIDTGEITVTQSYHSVAAESGTADSLDTINGGIDGDFLVLLAATGHTITVTENGNIEVTGGIDTMDDDEYEMMIYNGRTSKWIAGHAP